ncbi:MAG: glycosyltransferase [Elusimicrobiota bacterium]
MKNNILVIAPHIPCFDTNAGDYRIFHIIRILTGKYRVFFFPLIYDRELEVYKKQLEESGVSVIESYPQVKEKLEEVLEKRSYNTVLFEFYSSAGEYADMVREYTDAKIIVDSHCLKFIENARGGPFPPGDILEKRKKEELSVYMKADLVLTVTPKERDILKGYMDTEVADLFTGTVIPGEIRSVTGRNNIIYAGSMNNLHNVDAVEYFAEDIFPILRDKIPGIKLYVAGSCPVKRIRNLSGDDIVVTGYVKDLSLYFSSFMVSVVPLRIGAGMKSKIIESMAWGCPVVSTAIGSEGMFFEEGKEITVSDEPCGFADSIATLYTDKEKWSFFSITGYSAVKERYSMELMERRLLEII